MTSVIHRTTNTTNNMEDTFVVDIKPSSTETTSTETTSTETTPTIYKTRPVLTSVLTKRTYADAFGKDETNYDGYEDARYGQHISCDFFTTNYGHATYYPKKIEITTTSRNIQQTEADKTFISEEIKFYMENRNLFNV